MNGRSAGLAAGLMVGLVAAVFLIKLANKDGRFRTEYDERQTTIRGKAYRYAFYTEILAQAVIMCLLMGGTQLFVEAYGLVFIGIVLGCLVLAGYCIWKDVYWGLNNNKKRYHVIFIASIALNVLPVVMSAKEGSLFNEEGRIGTPVLNICALVMIGFIYAELLIKGIMDKNAEDKE